MELSVFKRTGDKKSESKQIRSEGNIPAVIYGLAGKDNESIYLSGSEFHAILHSLEPGYLSTTVFSLKKEKTTQKAIIKEIQYHPTTYNIRHIDFQVLDKDVSVEVNVPIIFTGVADCVGIKLGGVLRSVIRKLKVRCLPKDLPAQFYLAVEKLNVGQSRKLKEIEIPQNVYPLANLEEVAVVIAKK